MDHTSGSLHQSIVSLNIDAICKKPRLVAGGKSSAQGLLASGRGCLHCSLGSDRGRDGGRERLGMLL